MLKFLKSALVAAAALTAAVSASAEEAAITMRTNIYDVTGPNNACTLVLGGTPGSYVMVDCGFGEVEYEISSAVYDPTTQTVKGTMISCQVSKEGIIKVIPDEGTVIDYLDAEGCGLEWIEFSNPEQIEILNVKHNSLGKLDLSDFTNLQICYLSDNPYDQEPLKIGKNHPALSMIEINAVYSLDPDFDIDTYPNLVILDAFAVPGITKLTPSGCPNLLRLSIDCTNVSELDLSKNAALAILNISETGIKEIDLSGCPALQELYATHQSSTYNPDVRLTSLDISMLPQLRYLFLAGNALTSIDVSKNPKLDHLWLQYNYLTSLDITACPDITSLRLDYNYFNFLTLPANRDTFREYEYVQRPLPVPQEVQVNTGLDLNAQTARPGTETYARLMRVKRDTPETPTALDESKYTWADGILTVTQAQTDSVYLELVNSDFPEIPLRTANFMVKRASAMGKPDMQMKFQPSLSEGQTLAMCIGIEGATPETPKTLHVTQGDGSVTSVAVTTSAMPAEPNVVITAVGYGFIELATDVSERVSAVGIDGVTMFSCDVTPMSSLRSLRLTDAGLYELDLRYNRCLESLILTGCHLGDFSLDGASGSYTKTAITYLDLSNNEMTSLTRSEQDPIEYFDVSNNLLTDIVLNSSERITYLDVSHNKLPLLRINYLASLRELHANDNLISEYFPPETNVLEYADFSRNCFTFANLPERGPVAMANFHYAPQAKIQIMGRAPGIDLSSQAVTIEGAPVQFAWIKADGTALAEGTDYTIADGRTRFLNTEVGPVHCSMTCAALPEFTGDDALMTTDVTPAPLPTHVAASFRTTANSNVTLSLGAHHNGSAIYIDWNGDGTDVEQYLLTDKYTVFSAQAKAGADVKVLTYDEDDDIRVFSISGARMSSFDGSNLTSIVTLSVNNAGLADFTLPTGGTLEELSLDGNQLTEFDLTPFPNLILFSASNNKLTTLDLTPCSNLQLLVASHNQITDLNFAPGNKLYYLDLAYNNIEAYDLQRHPLINTASFANNRLTSINPAGLSRLRSFDLNGNLLTFATIPVPDEAWTRYTYANQAPVSAEVNGLVVDLSSQKEVNGTPTVYRWFIGEPTLDTETGELVGEELVAGEEYTISDGVTTLTQGFDMMMCVMTNEVLPNVLLSTDMLNISALPVIETDADDASAVYYTIDGRRVATPGSGLYIVVRGSKVTKELIK